MEIIEKLKSSANTILLLFVLFFVSSIIAEPNAIPSTPTLIFPPNGYVASLPGTLLLRWSSVSNATNYHLQVSTSYSFSNYMVNDSTITDTSKTITISYNEYYWRVQAKNADGASNWSSIRSIGVWVAIRGVNGNKSNCNIYPYPSPARLEFYLPNGIRLCTLPVDGSKASFLLPVAFAGKNYAKGVYLYRMSAGGKILSNGIVVNK